MFELSGERKAELCALAHRLGFSIHNADLFDHALTHASIYVDASGPGKDYESLEFLGDAVLGLAVAHHLFEALPDRTPGEYSRMRAGLVNRKNAARVGLELDIAPAIRLGKGEELSGGRGRISLIADCIEALIGAIYLDSGWECERDFVVRIFRGELDRAHEFNRVWDFKSRLQNHCQAEHIGLPVFELIRSDGPDHKKEFEIMAWVGGVPSGTGRGASKKEAEQNAARAALEQLGQRFE